LQWLFIDIGGTIIDDRVWREYLDRLLIDVIRAAAIEVTYDEFASARQRTAESKASRPTVAAINEFINDDDEAIRLFGEAYENLKYNFEQRFNIPRFLTRNAFEGLSSLGKDFQLATLSNNISKVRYLLDISGVSGFFDKHFISEEVGAAKPDEAIFAAALQVTGVAPDQAMMVGDRPDNDILPAGRLGMRTALIRNDNGKTESDIKAGNADIICSNLLELAEFLKIHQ